MHKRVSVSHEVCIDGIEKTVFLSAAQKVLLAARQERESPKSRLTGGILSAGNLKELLDVGDFGRHLEVGGGVGTGYLRDSSCVVEFAQSSSQRPDVSHN